MALKTTIKRQLADIFEERELEDVLFFTHTPRAKVTELEEAYFQVLNHCDRRKLYFEKGFYVLVVSHSNTLSCQINVIQRNKSQQRKKLKQMLELIKQHQPNGKVFLAQNNPSKSVSPDKEETLLARHLAAFSKTIDMELVDQFIMSSTEYFSFNENHYMQDI